MEAPMDATAAVVATIAYLGRCRKCSTGMRLEVPAVELVTEIPGDRIDEANAMQERGLFDNVEGMSRFAARMAWLEQFKVQVEKPANRYESRYRGCESCGHDVSVKLLKAKRTAHECDARCMNATGPNCECSCNGANHGAGYLPSITV